MGTKKKSGIEAELITVIGALLFLWLYFGHPKESLPVLLAIEKISIVIAGVVFVYVYFIRKQSPSPGSSSTPPDLGYSPLPMDPDRDLYRWGKGTV